MRRICLIAAFALLPLAWWAAGRGFVGHMTGHMVAVAIAAPLATFALRATRFDPALRWPRIVTPLAMSLVELAVVWGWHLPALRALADAVPIAMVIEQASFLLAGWLLWSAVLSNGQRAAGVGAMLLTSMHMTLLGALIGLAPRPLYPTMVHHGGDALADQQLGGVVMLMVGAASYFLGGLALLATLLREPEHAA